MIGPIRLLRGVVVPVFWSCAVLLAPLRPATAQAPAPVLRFVVPAPPGGNMDGAARLIAGRLSARLEQPVVIDNRPGAQTAVGTELAVRAAPDGNTLLLVGSSILSNPAFMKLSYDALTDLAPVGGLTRERYALAVRKDLPVTSLDEFLELARAPNAKLSCAAGPGVMLLGCNQLRLMTGADIVIVPFNGAEPVAAALLGGHVDMAFLATDLVLRQQAGNGWRVLAMGDSFPTRPPLPPVPSLPGRLPGFSAVGMFGLMVPVKTPRERVERLSQAVAEVLAEPAVQEHFARQGHVLFNLGADDFGAFLSRETQRIGAIVRRAGIKAP